MARGRFEPRLTAGSRSRLHAQETCSRQNCCSPSSTKRIGQLTLFLDQGVDRGGLAVEVVGNACLHACARNGHSQPLESRCREYRLGRSGGPLSQVHRVKQVSHPPPVPIDQGISDQSVFRDACLTDIPVDVAAQSSNSTHQDRVAVHVEVLRTAPPPIPAEDGICPMRFDVLARDRVSRSEPQQVAQAGFSPPHNHRSTSCNSSMISAVSCLSSASISSSGRGGTYV